MRELKRCLPLRCLFPSRILILFIHVIFLNRQEKTGIFFPHGKKKQMGIPTFLPCQIIMSSLLGMYVGLPWFPAIVADEGLVLVRDPWLLLGDNPIYMNESPSTMRASIQSYCKNFPTCLWNPQPTHFFYFWGFGDVWGMRNRDIC